MKKCCSKIINWIKENKLASVLILIVLFLLFRRRSFIPRMLGSSMPMYDSVSELSMGSVSKSANYGVGGGRLAAPSFEAAPQPDVTDRKVITRSSMSLQVKSVRDVMESIKKKVAELGGYVVETSVTTPEFGEDGSIVVRIPAENLDSTLEYFRGLAVKVVSENISGSDITDEYIDVEERITRLEKTKARFEEILDSATEVEDMLNVQRQIFNLQDQIDNYKGQLEYMEGASSTTLIKIYLSTDELGLPYTPVQAWRPATVFKQATRSLLLNLIKIGNAAIWIAVYIPLVGGAALLYLLIKKVAKRKTPPSQT
jgi:hypothetical protein